MSLMNINHESWYTRWAILVPPEGDVELIQLPEIHSENPQHTLHTTGEEFLENRFFPPGTSVYIYAIHTPTQGDALRLTDPGRLLPTDYIYTNVFEINP